MTRIAIYPGAAMRIAYFDLETTGLDEDSHITCGVIAYSGGDTEWYHSGYGRPMSAGIGRQMLDALSAADRVVSFNGAQFDFKCLWRLTGDERAKTLAKSHVDLILMFAYKHGFFTSMNSFATGTFHGEVSKSNTGGWAATAWASGGKTAEEVVEYCEQDTIVLMKLYERLLATGGLTRQTKAGKNRPFVAGTTAAELGISSADAIAAYVANPPNVSWMTGDPPDIAGVLTWAA